MEREAIILVLLFEMDLIWDVKRVDKNHKSILILEGKWPVVYIGLYFPNLSLSGLKLEFLSRLRFNLI